MPRGVEIHILSLAGMKKIINFFAREHLLGNIITIFVLLAGLQALWSIRRDIWPDVDFNITVLNTFFPGASTSQVEKLVTNPIEQALQEVDGLKQVNSISTENRSVVILQLDREARSPDETNDDIRTAIEQTADLPDEVTPPVVTPVRSQNQGILEVTVGLRDESPHNTLALHEAADTVADQLLLLPLSAGVQKKGLLPREYHVLTSWDKLSRYQVSLQALVQSIKGHNISLPAGKLRLDDGRDILFRTESQYQGADDIKNTIVQANNSGFFTRIADVARVEAAVGEPAYLYRANGKASINLLVEKKAQADVYSLVESVKTSLVKWKKIVGNKIELGVANDFSIYLTNRISTLKTNLLIGLALVTLLLALFLPWPVALVVGVGIPVAFFASLALAQALGFSINVVSLLGLIIVLGMLVDDAIVVSENIWRHVQQAEDLVPAVVNGAREVFGPVLASVLTTMSAFSPMLFMSGIMGSFIFEIPAMVVMALSFSLLEVFIVMPAHFVSWVGPFVKTAARKKEKALWFTRLTYKYAAYVDWSLGHSKKMLALLVLIVVGTGALVYKLNRFVLFPGEGVDLVFISSEAPMGSSLEKTSQLIQPIEQAILKLSTNELVDFSSSIGIVQQSANDPFTRRGSHFAQTRIRLTPINKRTRTAEEILAQLKRDVTQKGFELGQRENLKVHYAQAQQGPPQGRPIQFSITGRDLGTLREVTDKIVDQMSTVEGVLEPQSSYTAGKSEWFVLVDHLAAAEMGLQSFDIARSVRAVFEGLVASSIRNLDKSIDIRVKIDEPMSTPDKALQQIRVGNRQGGLVHLSKVAKFEQRPSISSIQHLDFKRSLSVSSRVNPDATALDVTKKIKPLVAKVLAEYPEYQVSWGGQDKNTKESMTSLFRSFWIALFFIFILLVVTFKNLLQPLVILSSVPLGFAGVSYAMLLHNRPFSFMSVLGMVALAGVIVNNSIVFVDFINKMRLQGESLKHSIVQTARVRLRPIFLTTMTTVCGLLPTAYGAAISKYTGFGGGDPFVVPIALALGWGLAIGTLLVILFMPSIVYNIDRLQMLLKKLLRRG